MGRPKGGVNNYHTKDEKLAVVKRKLDGETGAKIASETGIDVSLINKWTYQYLHEGGDALENKRKPGNPLVKYTRKKELTPTEQLEYENLKLKRELMKERAKCEALKKSIELYGRDAVQKK